MSCTHIVFRTNQFTINGQKRLIYNKNRIEFIFREKYKRQICKTLMHCSKCIRIFFKRIFRSMCARTGILKISSSKDIMWRFFFSSIDFSKYLFNVKIALQQNILRLYDICRICQLEKDAAFYFCKFFNKCQINQFLKKFNSSSLLKKFNLYDIFIHTINILM